ncbi:MAG TPA: hypothetical protein VLZ12_09275 [Verrucomicrobiae bacterium]|nr:hypothetical protein [Verrucomicrobiae bacterium]
MRIQQTSRLITASVIGLSALGITVRKRNEQALAASENLSV